MKFFLMMISLIFTINCFAAEKIKLIYDNDAAFDDIMALIYLAHQPNILIEGITITATGEAAPFLGAKNIADVCDLLKKPNIPIAYGNEKPNDSFTHPFPKWVRTSTNQILLNKNVPHNPHPKISPSAIELMKNIVMRNDKISILATGPLTNIADFIEKYPSLKNKIEKIVIMGGAVHVKGNIQALDPRSNNFVAEWNIYADPKSAQIVFSSGIPITLVPLDVTNQVPVTKMFYENLSQQSQPDLNLIYLILKGYVDDLGADAFFSSFYLWDTLAAIIVSDPTEVVTESLPISISIKMAQTRHVKLSTPHFAMINVATKISDTEGPLTRFINTIKQRDE